MNLVMTTPNLKKLVCHRCEIKEIFFKIDKNLSEKELLKRACSVEKNRTIEIDLKDNQINECNSVCFSKRDCRALSYENELMKRIIKYILTKGYLAVTNFHCGMIGIRGHQGSKRWQDHYENSVVGEVVEKSEVALCSKIKSRRRERYESNYIETYTNLGIISGATVGSKLEIEYFIIYFYGFLITVYW